MSKTMKKLFSFLGMLILFAALLYLIFSYKASPDKTNQQEKAKNISFLNVIK
jgi:hypothetical protein